MMRSEGRLKFLLRPAVWPRLVLVFSLLVFEAYAGCAMLEGGHGFNYSAYNYFSGLYWQGENPYQAPNVTVTEAESFRRPSYLDYTGAQLLVYNVCTYVSIHFGVDGFVLYSLFLLLLALILAYRLAVMEVLNWQEYLLFLALILSPYLWHVLLFFSYEDKVLYILLPLAVLYTHSKSVKATGWLIGLATGLIGIAVALYPLLGLSILCDTAQAQSARYKTLITVTGCLLVGCATTLVPFFPDSMLGWQRRAILESSAPFWFSFWTLIDPLYVSGLNKIFIVLACLVVYWLFAVGRLEFKAAIILVLSSFFTFSVTMGPQRIMPFVVMLAIAFRHPLPRMVYCGVAFTLIGIFWFLDKSNGFFQTYPASLAIAQGKSLLLLSPILLGYSLVSWDNIKSTKEMSVT